MVLMHQYFLDQLLQVKVVVNLKGRENEFRNIAIELIKRFQSDVGEVCDVATCVIVLDTIVTM